MNSVLMNVRTTSYHLRNGKRRFDGLDNLGRHDSVVDIERDVPWYGSNFTKCASKGSPVDRVLELGSCDPGSVTRWPVIVRACYEYKSGGTGHMVL